jgi:hypothetical protein
VPQAPRFPLTFAVACTLAFGQTPVQVVEPPEQAQKLLNYAAKLEADAQRAIAAGQHRALADARTALSKDQFPDTAEDLIDQRTEAGNGIYVDQPKVYDDSLLQQMLTTAQSRLVAIQTLDQSGIAKAVGNVTGANQQIASFGAAGGMLPPSITTAAGTTSSAFSLPTGTAPAPTTSLPTSQAPSASDVLNEQVQLTAEIANLRLLLEGSLSDQIMVGAQETFAKPRATLGFPVIISPQRHYKNAVAVVEVMVETNRDNDASAAGEPPSITALLPREKTYNVASISDKSVALGGGVATALAGASATFLWGHKQYFIVKDQDTLAEQFQPSEAEFGALAAKGVDTQRVRAFAWQFRPVLGRQFVQAGSKQVFVQLAFPGRASVKSFGNVMVRTYWRRFDAKTGILKEVIPDSLRDIAPSKIANYDMRQRYGAVAAFNSTWMEDLGTGQMLVKLEGRLLPGSYLRVGSNIIQPGVGGVPSDLKTTRFLANIADLATLKTFVISRDGTEYPLKIQPGPKDNSFWVDRQHVTVTALDESASLLQVPISNFSASQDIPPVLLIGGKVFGYADAPIDRICNSDARTCVLSVALPTAFLAASPAVTVKALMLDEDGAVQGELKANRTFTVFPQSAVQEKLVYLTRDEKTATYLLYGHDLNQVKIVWPARNVDSACPPDRLCLQPLNPSSDDGSLKLIKLPLDFAKDAGSLILQRPAPADRPFVLAVPAPPANDGGAAATSKKQDPKFQERIVVGSDEAAIVGDNLNAITAVQFGAKPLTIGKRTANLIKLSGLAAAGASASAKTQDITLVSLAGSSKIKLEVVTNKVEILPK